MAIYRGTVIDNADPKKRGRVRVWVWGIHKALETEEIDYSAKLPWAEVACNVQYNDSIFDVGDIVWVMFEQDDLQCPVVIGAARVGSGSTSSINQQVVNDDYYGKTHTIENDAGYLRFNEAEDRIVLRTKSGYVLDLNGGDKYLRLITPCCAELNLKCDSGSVELFGTKLKFNGQVIAAGGGGGHCGEDYTGLSKNNGSSQTGGKTEQSSNQVCNPTTSTDGNQNNCSTVTPANTNIASLDAKLQRVIADALEEAKQSNNEFFVIEGKIDNKDRYVCLKRANSNSVHPSMLEGKGVLLSVDKSTQDISTEELTQVTGMYYDTNDKVHFTLDGRPAPYKSDNANVRALARALYGEVSGRTDGTNSFSDAAHNITSVIFNRATNPCRVVIDSKTVVGVIDASRKTSKGTTVWQFSYNGDSRIKNMKASSASLWDKCNDLAIIYYNSFVKGTWQSSVGKAQLYANMKTEDGNFRKYYNAGTYIPVFGTLANSTDKIGHSFFYEKGC